MYTVNGVLRDIKEEIGGKTNQFHTIYHKTNNTPKKMHQGKVFKALNERKVNVDRMNSFRKKLARIC